ncbi:FAD assembly factor SdhE [Ovoidimarina sediminis]|uniref:FAD assembly factor SdhE n=1 Tax=Ovoidimarina sediminis TaxID=3079856 RepID=UPI002912B61B|nr:succinate dehydrogenase assembly factor 2 [Rhodophyticola sp. MJ-SS7]MDU8943901.1 succinate dehydrogenase assembly factor 2 [Rhodophyticola sp. MJ-SS7]
MTEAAETRLKRLKIRSWRRGTKEMDLILGKWSDRNLPEMDETTLDAYEALLDENDQDLYLWVSGQAVPPEHLAPLISRIARETVNHPN